MDSRIEALIKSYQSEINALESLTRALKNKNTDLANIYRSKVKQIRIERKSI